MLVEEFSPAELERFSQQALADPVALVAVVVRLWEIANLEGHSYGAVRLAREALRALGAEVPLCHSEILRQQRERANGGADEFVNGAGGGHRR